MSSEYFVVKRGSTALANRVVLDKSLSFTALGVLATLLALPPEAPKGYRALLGRGLGEKAVRNALTELADHGFRHQFKVRITGGQLRTVTVISDEPITPDEAREVVQARRAGHLLPTPADNENEPQKPSSHRAADGAARSDLRVYSGTQPGPDTRQTPTEPRPTVPRSTAARSTTAQLAKANSKEAKASQPNQTPTRERSGQVQEKPQAQPATAPTGAAPPPGPPRDHRPPTADDMALIAQCLPPKLRALDTAGAVRVAGLLRQRVNAGWTPTAIWTVMDTPTPPSVNRLSNLVAYRLNANCDPASAPRTGDKPRAKPVNQAAAAEVISPPHEQAWREHVWDPAFVQAGGHDASTPSEIITATKTAKEALRLRGLDFGTWPGFWAEAVQAHPDLDPEDPEAWPGLVDAARDLAMDRLEAAS